MCKKGILSNMSRLHMLEEFIVLELGVICARERGGAFDFKIFYYMVWALRKVRVDIWEGGSLSDIQVLRFGLFRRFSPIFHQS